MHQILNGSIVLRKRFFCFLIYQFDCERYWRNKLVHVILCVRIYALKGPSIHPYHYTTTIDIKIIYNDNSGDDSCDSDLYRKHLSVIDRIEVVLPCMVLAALLERKSRFYAVYCDSIMSAMRTNYVLTSRESPLDTGMAIDVVAASGWQIPGWQELTT